MTLTHRLHAAYSRGRCYIPYIHALLIYHMDSAVVCDLFPSGQQTRLRGAAALVSGSEGDVFLSCPLCHWNLSERESEERRQQHDQSWGVRRWPGAHEDLNMQKCCEKLNLMQMSVQDCSRMQNGANPTQTTNVPFVSAFTTLHICHVTKVLRARLNLFTSTEGNLCSDSQPQLCDVQTKWLVTSVLAGWKGGNSSAALGCLPLKTMGLLRDGASLNCAVFPHTEWKQETIRGGFSIMAMPEIPKVKHLLTSLLRFVRKRRSGILSQVWQVSRSEMQTQNQTWAHKFYITVCS